MTIEDLTNWCLKQQPRAFKNWTEAQITMTIREHVDHNTIIVVCDRKDIHGLVLYKKLVESREYYIEQLVTNKPKQVFQLFVAGLQKNTPEDLLGWKITGRYKGSERKREFLIEPKLIEKLSRI